MIRKVCLGRIMRLAVSCLSYLRVAVCAGVLTSHPIISDGFENNDKKKSDKDTE